MGTMVCVKREHGSEKGCTVISPHRWLIFHPVAPAWFSTLTAFKNSAGRQVGK